MRGYAFDVLAHYHRPALLETILEGFRAAGKEPPFEPRDLAPVDQFHLGGRVATEALAERARITAGMRVLDAGGGIGGAARAIAASTGAHVTVLDVIPEYCRPGAELPRLCGLGSRVDFREGDALEMPFDDGVFDVVLSQHVTMNIDEKARLFREVRRVLRPGGTFALHEVVSGGVGSTVMPVPWASNRGMNFLVRPDEFRELLRDAGFDVRQYEDVSHAALYWLRSALPWTRAARSRPPLGLHLLLGSVIEEMDRNVIQNLEDWHITVIRAVCTRR